MSDCRFGVSPVNYPDPEQFQQNNVVKKFELVFPFFVLGDTAAINVEPKI